MLGTVTTFLSAHANAIVRTLGVSTMLGSAAHLIYAEKLGASKNESSETKVQSLMAHNVVFALGAMVTLVTLTVGNKMDTKTRIFCVLCSALTALYPTAVVGTAYLIQKKL